MQFTLLTYNTLLSDAQRGLRAIFQTYKPDIACLQEIDTNEYNLQQIENNEYHLADYSNGFIKFGKVYGVATFFSPKTISFSSSKSINLPRGYLEILSYVLRIFRTKKKDRTVLRTRFSFKQNEKKVIIYNIHLSAHGTNGIRLKQLKKTLADIAKENGFPTILVGDFNYPYGRKKLEELMHENGFLEATNHIQFTSDGKLLHYSFFEKILAKILQSMFGKNHKLDYMFYKNCVPLSTVKIDVPYSDHFPIITKFEV